MISFERLYSRQCPKSINAEQTSRGPKPLTLDDILNLIGRIQSKYMVGSFVWEVRIAMDNYIKKRLIDAMTTQLRQLDIEYHIASAMAKAAVREVCDTNICDKCHGTGQSYSKKYAKLFECKKCQGKCRTVKTHSELLNWINSEVPAQQRITTEQWRQLYDIFMDCVDELNKSAADAMGYGKKLIRRLDAEYTEDD